MDQSGVRNEAATAADPLRVMVVDDSAVIRGLIIRALETDPEIKVVASVGDGQMALNAVQRQPIDVIVLDIEMPVMDGISALPKLIEASPGTKVIMASTLTVRNAEISLKAMAAGAADYVPKPSTREIHGAETFKRELIGKVKAWGAVARKTTRQRPRPVVTTPARPAPKATPATIRTREMPAQFRPEVIAIGSSTGGPQALFEVLSHLGRGQVGQPILITQHMPATFTTILADHISRQCGLSAREAVDAEPLVGGRCYIAPGDYHMTVETRPGGPVLRLNQEPPENFCRPAVDPMLRSLAAGFAGRVLTVILTGMGQDGLKGCRVIAEAGGVVIAQDEGTSVVWGMPGAVSHAGLANAVLPLKEIGPFIRRLAQARSAA